MPPAPERETSEPPAPAATEDQAVDAVAVSDDPAGTGLAQETTRPAFRTPPPVTPPPFPSAYPAAGSATNAGNPAAVASSSSSSSSSSSGSGVSERRRSDASSISVPEADDSVGGESAAVRPREEGSTSAEAEDSVAASGSGSAGAGAAVRPYGSEPVVNPAEPEDSIAAAKESLIRAYPFDPNTPVVVVPPADAPPSEVPDIPAVLAPLSPDYPEMFPEVPVLDALAEAFNRSLVEEGYDPDSPDASEVWREGVARSDSLFRLYYGDAAYVRMDQQRVRVDSE
ncbi:MAG: hypothetical protein ACLFSZ_01970 [Puniceicoccaceae bacterium]